MRIFSTREEDHRYLQGRSSVPARKVISTHEAYPQHLWGRPVRYIISIKVPMRKIISTHDWVSSRYSVPLSDSEREMNEVSLTGTAYPHGYWWSPTQLLNILKGTVGMPQEYWWYSSQVLYILTGTADMPHRYWWSSSRIMNILNISSTYPQGYSI